MKRCKVSVRISDTTICLMIDDKHSPKTVEKFLRQLPFTVKINLWGEEIYTDESPILQEQENAKELLEVNDVAYWPQGKAICLFYGPTPIGNKGEIKSYSPVNVIGKILNPDKDIPLRVKDKMKATFSKSV